MTDNGKVVSATRRIRFGTFELEPDTGTLRRAGVALKLQPRPARMLCLLAGRPGQLVSREEIQRYLWGERAVEADHGINTCVRQIRSTLNDPADAPAYVETIPRKGYRFIAPVTEVDEPSYSVPIAVPARKLGRAVAIVVLFVAALLALTIWIVGTEDRVTVAVLPFHNLTGDPDTEYFAAAVTEEIITELTKLSPASLGVIARTSTLRFTDPSTSLDSASALLNVDYVIQGSVRRDNNRVRVTAQLIRLSDKTQAWAERFDNETAPALAVSATVARHVVRALVPDLLPERESNTAIVDDSPARELVLRGRYVLAKGTTEFVEHAVDLFRSATERDSSYAAAYLGLADAIYLQNTKSPAERMPEVRRYARTASNLDPGLANAHLRLGAVALYYDWNLDVAWSELRRASELSPGAVEPHRLMADYFTARGNSEQAIKEMQLAVARDPLAAGLIADVGMTYYAAREYDNSLKQCSAAYTIEPRHPSVLDCFLRVYRVLGQDSAAATWALEMIRAFGDSATADFLQREQTPSHVLRGFDDWIAQGLEDWANDRYVSPFLLAIVDTYRGRPADALDHLTRGVALRDRWMIFLDAEPRFDMLRANPRFKTIRHSVGLSEP